MNILLKRIIEQQGLEGQYYDLGRDFSNFRRTMDGNTEQIKQKFEQSIGSKLNGKRILARASRGYKQFEKTYEFDVSKITLDDYYDNYVVVAHDTSTPKPKEYFLKPGFKITIVGTATGKPSPQKGNVEKESPNISTPNITTHPKIQNQLSVKEDTKVEFNKDKGHYNAYSIDTISKDIELWIPNLLIKPETILRDFIKKLGWMKTNKEGKSVAMFDISVPKNVLKKNLTSTFLNAIFDKINAQDSSTKYELKKMEPSDADDEWNIRIKKTTI